MCVWYSCNSNHLPLTALPPTPTSQCNWNPLVFFIHFSSWHASNITSSNQKGVVCNLEAACVGGMNIKITELAKLRPTKLEIGTGLPVYHQVCLFEKCPVCIFFNTRPGTCGTSTIRNKLSNSSWEWPKSLLTSGLKQKRWGRGGSQVIPQDSQQAFTWCLGRF